MVGEDRWRELWLERLDGSPFPAETWLEHQRRDAYWQQGSVCEDYGAIEAAVYAVGGWNDGYTSAILRLLDGLVVPAQGADRPVGAHVAGGGHPGAAIGFLQEALRFWDHWLKGRDTGVMDGPMLRFWLQDSVPPRGAYDVRPGRWAAEDTWPSPRIARTTAYLTADGLRPTPGTATRFPLQPADAGRRRGLLAALRQPGRPARRPARRRTPGRCASTPSRSAAPIELLGIPRLRCG